ncbi:hypothetical protein L4D76_15565 [Photobacterium sagamiensis]|uniref:hypothetical protein n=1 Tax=Photobacterium sagamiensis TaxID=2910241 RepID=UPI003D10ADBA
MELADFNARTEDMWGEQDNKLQNKVSATLSKHSHEDHFDIVENYALDLHLNQYKYPSIHRESIVITIYNYLEHALNDLCKILSSCISSDLKLKDLNGAGTERAILYLKKVVGFDFGNMGKELPYIKNANMLRNQIVHNGGYLPENSKHKLNNFIGQCATLSGEPSGSVVIYSGFISELIDILVNFFEKLDEQVQLFICSHNA